MKKEEVGGDDEVERDFKTADASKPDEADERGGADGDISTFACCKLYGFEAGRGCRAGVAVSEVTRVVDVLAAVMGSCSSNKRG